MPPPESWVNLPGSSPATTTLRLAASTIASAVRLAQGPSHSEQAPTSATTGATSIMTGRSRRRGPTPTAVSTAISESR